MKSGVCPLSDEFPAIRDFTVDQAIHDQMRTSDFRSGAWKLTMLVFLVERIMAQAQVTQQFDIPAEQLWELIGDFGNMSKWTGLPPETCVQEGDGVGCIRTLTVPRGIIVDRLDAMTPNSYSYSVINASESPLPYKSYRATMTVDPVTPTSSQLTWAGEFEPDNISEEEAISNVENMYQMGIGLMKTTLGGEELRPLWVDVCQIAAPAQNDRF
jgi:hypothetical protein